MPFAIATASSSARILAAAVLAVLAAAWYAGYATTGFNVADDGHFAQVAFEFLNGTQPHDVKFGYGLAWFKAGQALFRLFGPNYAVIQVFFYGLLAATAVLSLLATAETTGRTAPALAVGAVLAAAPAFPPTAFYAFCTLLNVYVQLRVAARLREASAPAFALAGAALSATFMIRADFGYIFALPLAGLLIATAVLSGRAAARCGAVAAGAFVLAQAPLWALAWRAGYLDLVVDDMLRYPKLLADYVAAGVGLTDPRAAAAAPAGAGALLPRAPLSALFPGHPQNGLAVLTYVPVAGLAICAAVWAATAVAAFRRGRVDAAPWTAARLVLLAGACAGFPHYFLFRPDLAHIANFMPGFLTAAAVFAADVAFGPTGRRERRERSWPGAAAGAASALATVAFAGFYLHYAFTNPGGGTAASAAGRDLPFKSVHGVDTLLAPAEIAWLRPLHDTVVAHSRPLDRIVCVPFCPGVAFMTGRRMLFREYYVDDSFLLTDPGWIDRAIALTESRRPPVIVVLDWAVNGGDISRFGVWAARYVAALPGLGYQPRPVPGGTVYVAGAM